jgi:DNA-directed RNA polymerase beta subunit
MTPQKLINPKALSAVIRDFFGRSQLSASSWTRSTRWPN